MVGRPGGGGARGGGAVVTVVPDIARLPTRTGTGAVRVDVLDGSRAVHALRAEYDDWTVRHGVPTTGSRGWVFAGLSGDERMHPWAVTARDADGALRGMLVLVDEPMNGQTVTTLAGADQGHRGVVAAESPEVAERLAVRVGDVLRGRGELSRLLLGPLHADDPCAHALADALPGAHLLADAPVPVVQRTAPDVSTYVTHNMRRTLRKARNRLATDGRVVAVQHTTDEVEITRLLPRLEQCHRERDHVHGRHSDLDDDWGRRVWYVRLYALAQENRLELSMLTIDGELAAHALGALDGSVYRVLEGRFVTAWARYSPGRLLEAEVLQRVLDDPSFRTLDWMTSVAPEKLLATNAADPMLLLHWVPGL